MKNLSKLAALAMTIAITMFVFQSTDLLAQTTDHGSRFVDENGDGYNDNAPDHDGDGIPNGQDPDYVKAEDGSGSQFGKMNGNKSGAGSRFIDEDGDGICDNFQDADGDGIPNCEDPDWVKPQDGTGSKFGQGKGRSGWNGVRDGSGSGSGDCDGTGPKGAASRAKSGAAK